MFLPIFATKMLFKNGRFIVRSEGNIRFNSHSAGELWLGRHKNVKHVCCRKLKKKEGIFVEPVNNPNTA